MGTRSLTHIHDDGKILLTMYKQFDGYQDGHGKELAAFLTGLHIVNGMSGETVKTANGMGCLAAMLIAHFKKRPGDVYIYPAGASDCGEEYVYHIKLGKDVQIPNGGMRLTTREANLVEMSVNESDGKELFTGTPEEFSAYLSKLKAAEVS